jgi:hypothetical protein
MRNYLEKCYGKECTGFLWREADMRILTGFLTICMICVLCVSIADAKQKRKETDYQKEWCSQHQGQAGVRLPDGTQCDCIATIDGVDYAIEIDFGNKWAKSIGQALYYAVQTDKHAGVVLILEDEKEYEYFARLNTTIQYHGLRLKTWLIKNYTGASVEPPVSFSLRAPQRVCSGTHLAGWIKVDDEWSPLRCGKPTAIAYNVWVLARYDNKPAGTVMSVCADAAIPPGWVKIDEAWIPTKCGHPRVIMNNVKRIKRMW